MLTTLSDLSQNRLVPLDVGLGTPGIAEGFAGLCELSLRVLLTKKLPDASGSFRESETNVLDASVPLPLPPERPPVRPAVAQVETSPLRCLELRPGTLENFAASAREQ